MTAGSWQQPGEKSWSLPGRLRTLSEWGSGEVGPTAERAVYVLLFALLVMTRMPRILLEGRFWAEEGVIFFRNAWTMPWYDALLVSYGGYLNLAANLAGVLARYLFPLSGAPYASTGLALLIQCIPALLIVTSRAEWLRSRALVWAALLLVLTAPDSQEVWMSSIGSQFYLALSAAIVLGIEPRSGPVGALHVFVLAAAALSGPASWMLAPLFMLRAAIDRSRPRTMQMLVLLAGVLVQLAFFFSQLPGRSVGIAPTLLGAIALKKHVITPFLTPFYTPLLFENWSSIADLTPYFNEAGGPIWPLLLVVLAFMGALGAAALYPRQAPLWFLLAGAGMAVSGYAGALGSKSWMLQTLMGGRYGFAAQVLFGLALLSWSAIHRGRARIYARAAVVVLLIVGLSDYFPAQRFQVQVGPRWPAEVEKWRQDSGHKLLIWPPNWSITLIPK